MENNFAWLTDFIDAWNKEMYNENHSAGPISRSQAEDDLQSN